MYPPQRMLTALEYLPVAATGTWALLPFRMHAGYVSVASTDINCWISASGSFESKHDFFYARILRLDLGLYFHLKE